MGVGKFFCRTAEIVKIGLVLVAFVKIIKLFFKLGELFIFFMYRFFQLGYLFT